MQRMWNSAAAPRRDQGAQLQRPRRAAGGHRRAPRVGAQRRPAGRQGVPRRRRRGAAAGNGVRAPPPPDGRRTHRWVHVEGLDDVLVRLANCCTPVPGDEIIGFVTRGRGVSVHRADCANAVSLMADQATRMIEVDWDGEQRGSIFRAGVEVVALDRSRLLRDVANALSATITSTSSRATPSPATTASPRCASSSSSPTPATSRRC